MNTELLKKMQEKFEQAGIPFEELKVFGAIRCNVHVVCIGRETAQKWSHLLSDVFGVKPYLGAHAWNAKVNRNTCMLPTLRKGFLVTIAA